MKFNEILKKSWNEYKENFTSIFIFMFVFSGIISIIMTVISIVWAYSDEKVSQLVLNPYIINGELFYLPWYYFIITSILSLLSVFLMLFVYAGLIGTVLRKSKYNYNDLVKNGDYYYFKYLAFIIVSGIFLFFLFLLLIIPSIIFMVYWIFGSYVLYDEKKGIIDSLKRSKEIVKGKWWKVFGYLLLLLLIFLGILIAVLIITLPLQVIQLSSIKISLKFFIFRSFFDLIINFIIGLIYIPIFVLFGKNFYFDLKKNSKKITNKKKRN